MQLSRPGRAGAVIGGVAGAAAGAAKGWSDVKAESADGTYERTPDSTMHVVKTTAIGAGAGIVIGLVGGEVGFRTFAQEHGSLARSKAFNEAVEAGKKNGAFKLDANGKIDKTQLAKFKAVFKEKAMAVRDAQLKSKDNHLLFGRTDGLKGLFKRNTAPAINWSEVAIPRADDIAKQLAAAVKAIVDSGAADLKTVAAEIKAHPALADALESVTDTLGANPTLTSVVDAIVAKKDTLLASGSDDLKTLVNYVADNAVAVKANIAAGADPATLAGADGFSGKLADLITALRDWTPPIPPAAAAPA